MNPPPGPVGQWFQAQVTKLYSPPPAPATENGSEFDSVFSSTFGADSDIVLNHEKTALGSFKENIERSQFAVQSIEIDWKDLLEDDSGDDKQGIVAGFFVVKRFSKFRIRVGPAESLQYSSFSAKIETVEQQYRISQLFLTSTEKAAPINLQGIPNEQT